MDINSLLSPDPESSNPSSRPASRTAPSRSPRSPGSSPNLATNGSSNNGHSHPPRPPNYPRKASSLSQQVTFSSDEDPAHHRHGHPHLSHSAKPKRHDMSSPSRRYQPASPTAQNSSLGPMDALAEVASRQRPQTIIRQHEKNPSTSSTATSSRSAVDAVMPDAPPSPDVYEFASLPSGVSKDLAVWAKRVSENPFDITAHTNLVQALHQEFVAHVESGKDPHSFEPVKIMESSRKAMNKIFPVGEELWLDWLTDENILSKSIDDRLSVMELHLQSVTEEVSSAPLWRRYGDYMYYLWSSSHSTDSTWSAEDQEIGKQVFTWQSMLDVWEQGIAKTQWHLNDSNLVWDRYMEILMGELNRDRNEKKINDIKDKFISRLTQRAHMSWEQTFQAFSQFITAYDSDHYEQTMSNVSERSSKVKQCYSQREKFEFGIQQAQDKSDKDGEWRQYTEYLAWELDNRGVFSMDLINGLFERATTRFSTDANLWIDYVETLIETPVRGLPVLGVLERATRHCPWSGDLWSHRILTMESENKTFEEIEEVKHKATASGLVDINGFEDLMKVSIAWCGYLRRRAFRPEASEDDVDMAEMGIRSSIEHVIQAGQKKYGNDFNGDPAYRLERIHLKFLFQKKDLTACRGIMNGLIPRVGDSYDFWYRYYILAMIVWGSENSNLDAVNVQPPREATRVLENAIQRVETMDMPEHLVPMYLNHCEQHETVQYYRTALIKARQATKKIEARRAREQKIWQEQQQEQQESGQKQPEDEEEEIENDNNKRKRGESQVEPHQQHKKQKQEEPPNPDEMEVDPAPKRDRENTTLVIRNLPQDEPVTITQIRQFFKDCGNIVDVHFYEENGSQVAMVEFETKEDALYGQTRSAKPFHGQTLSIEFSTGSTLWVTNYPPTADEKYIRNLFSEYGDVVEVRFPSLKANTHRRFCYVQFLLPVAAQKASSALDGTVLDGKFHLKAKISDPSVKENRQGALEEGREVIVKNLQFKASESEVKELFEKFGTMEKVRIPTKLNGMGTGVAFIIFASKEEAEKAVEEVHNTSFQNRTLQVEIAVPKNKRSDTRRARTDTPETESVVSAPTEPAGQHYKDRSIALLHLSDTVNSAQLEKIIQESGEDFKKIVLRPDHAGAIVEMSSVPAAAKLSLFLEGKEIGDTKVAVGTVDQLFKEKPMVRADTLAKKKDMKLGSGVLSRPGAVSRPGQKARIGGARKTGLGFARRDSPPAEGEGGKTNAEFRSMFLNGKKED